MEVGRRRGADGGYRGGCEKRTGRADHSTKVERRKIQLRRQVSRFSGATAGGG